MYMNAMGGFAFDLYPTGGVATYAWDTIEFGMLERSWFQMGEDRIRVLALELAAGNGAPEG